MIHSIDHMRMSGPGSQGDDASDAMVTDAVDFSLWSSAQNLALSKLKVFHGMAKSISDQQ